MIYECATCADIIIHKSSIIIHDKYTIDLCYFMPVLECLYIVNHHWHPANNCFCISFFRRVLIFV